MFLLLLGAALATRFYLRSQEEELCVAHRLALNDEAVLDLEQRDPFTPGLYLYVIVRSTLRRSKSPIESFVLRDQQRGRFIYHHNSRGDVFFCFNSFGEVMVAVSIERKLAAPEGLITAGDLHALERELYAATSALAEFRAGGEQLLAGEEDVVAQNAAVDRRLGRLGLAAAGLLAGVCLAQYLALARWVAPKR